MTRGEWDEAFWASFHELRRLRPDLSPAWAQKHARQNTEVEHGPRPPGKVGIGLGLLVGYLKGGGKVKWGKVGWKTLRPILGGAALIGLYAVAEALLNATDTQAELEAIGAPALLIPILLGLGAGARNWLKHRNPKPVK